MDLNLRGCYNIPNVRGSRRFGRKWCVRNIVIICQTELRSVLDDVDPHEHRCDIRTSHTYIFVPLGLSKTSRVCLSLSFLIPHLTVHLWFINSYSYLSKRLKISEDFCLCLLDYVTRQATQLAGGYVREGGS
jgi:hypothetical protein